MSGSNYSSLPLGEDMEALETKIDTLITDIATLETSIDALETNINSVGNGNPAQMYSYAEDWHDATVYSGSGGTSTKVTSDAIDVTDMRFIMISFDAYGVEGGGSGGSQRVQAVISGQSTYYSTDFNTCIFDTVANDDLGGSYVTYYGWIPVASLSGDQTIAFQTWTSGGDAYFRNARTYAQILI